MHRIKSMLTGAIIADNEASAIIDGATARRLMAAMMPRRAAAANKPPSAYQGRFYIHRPEIDGNSGNNQ